MNRTFWLLPLGAALAAFSVSAAAQYTGPGAEPAATSVAALRTHSPAEQRVHMYGYLVRQVGGELYMFSDGQQEIRAAIDNKRFPARPVNAFTPVEITGKLERHGNAEPKIDIRTIRVVD